VTASQHVWGALDFAFKSTVEGLQVLRDLGKRQDLTPMPRTTSADQPTPTHLG
jgi:hypothetical protein